MQKEQDFFGYTRVLTPSRFIPGAKDALPEETIQLVLKCVESALRAPCGKTVTDIDGAPAWENRGTHITSSNTSDGISLNLKRDVVPV